MNKNNFRANLYIICISMIILILSMAGDIVLYNKLLTLKLLLGVPIIITTCLIIDISKKIINNKKHDLSIEEKDKIEIEINKNDTSKTLTNEKEIENLLKLKSYLQQLKENKEIKESTFSRTRKKK